MSTRFFVAAVAGVVVGYYGGPQAGFATFSAIYGVTGFLDPNAKVQGPRLDDLKIASGAYGAPVGYIEGHPRIGGNIVWCTEKREVSHESTADGKGGPGVDTTTFTYEVDMMVMIDEKPGTLVRRIFSNGGLVWTIADDADGTSLAASQVTDSWREIRFCDGNDAQLPDPTYEAAVGVGNAPAYRGRSTIVIVGLNCGGNGQLPVLTFEVSSSSENAVVVSTLATVPQDRSYVGGIPAMSLSGFQMLVGIYADGYIGRADAYHVDTSGTVVPQWSILLPSDGVFGATCATGNSDVSCIVVADGSAAIYRSYSAESQVSGFPDGIYDCTAGGELANDATKFCRRGGDIAIGANNGLAKRIWHFPVGGGLFTGTYATMAQNVTSVAIGNGNIYAGKHDETGIYVLDMASMTLIDTIPAPALGCVGSSVLCKTDGTLCFLSPICLSIVGFAGAVWEWNGSSWTMTLAGIGVVAGDSVDNDTSLSYADGVYMSQDWLSDHVAISFVAPRLAALDIPLDEVVQRQWQRAGLDLALLDASALASLRVRAMAVSQITSPRQVIDTLSSAYLFEAVESGDGVRMVRRGGAPVATIPFEDLGAYTGDQVAEPFPRTRGNELETPAQVTVKFANVDDDYQDGSETSARAATGSSIVTVVELPLGLTPTEARKLADVSVTDALASITRVGPVVLTRKWARLESTDVVLLTARDGSTFRTRWTKRTDAEGLLTFEGVLDDATAINSAAVTSGGYNSSSIVRAAGDTIADELDIPILRDADNAPGYYVAAKGVNETWRGYTYLDSVDDVNYSKIYDTRSRSVLGNCTTVLADFDGGNVFDEAGSVTVDVGAGTLASTTVDEILAGTAPGYLVGSEILFARTATLSAPGIYTLTSLLRGQRGTEWAMDSHIAGERFVRLEVSGLRRVAEEITDIGVLHYVKAVTAGKSAALVTSQRFTDTGIALKPFAPVDIAKTDSASATTISWNRRSRLASRFMATVQPPLGEASEAYDVELRNTGDELISTTRVTTPQWTSAAAVVASTLQAPAWGLKVIGGDLVGVRDDFTGVYTTPKALIRFDPATGLQIEQSPTLANEVYQWCNDGDELYVATADFSGGVPTTYSNSKVQRLARTALGTVAATYTAPVPGDIAGVAHDGTDVWITEYRSGNLRRLDSTALTSIASYAVNLGVTAMLFDAGSLWICSSTNYGAAADELIEFDAASHTELQRFAVVAAPQDILIVGGVVFVKGGYEVGVYTMSTGVELNRFANSASPIGYAQRNLTTFGSYVAVAGALAITLLDATTGATVRSFPTGPAFANYITAVDPFGPPVSAASSYFWAVSGENGSDLMLTVGAPGHSAMTLGYELQAASLAGYSVTVYQVSAAVGRGYPATLDL